MNDEVCLSERPQCRRYVKIKMPLQHHVHSAAITQAPPLLQTLQLEVFNATLILDDSIAPLIVRTNLLWRSLGYFITFGLWPLVFGSTLAAKATTGRRILQISIPFLCLSLSFWRSRGTLRSSRRLNSAFASRYTINITRMRRRMKEYLQSLQHRSQWTPIACPTIKMRDRVCTVVHFLSKRHYKKTPQSSKLTQKKGHNQVKSTTLQVNLHKTGNLCPSLM